MQPFDQDALDIDRDYQSQHGKNAMGDHTWS